MARLAIYSHAPSDSVNLLKEHFEGQGINLIKIKRNNSRFAGREGDIIINYGASSFPMERVGRGRLLNNPTAIAQSSNKLTAFQRFQEAGVKVVEWTNRQDIAQGWVEQGGMVYARTTLQGHSGAGIVIGYTNPAGVGDAGDVQVVSTLPRAQLYTKAILQERREFRIHILDGKITYVQQKKRRDGYREDAAYSNLVRNHHTGWIYATQNASVCDEAKREALKAISALGLDFGAVDVITRRDEAWVLEVNTAPGMSGTNLETYANNFTRLLNGEAVEGEVLTERVAEFDAMVAHQQAQAQQEPTNDNQSRNDSRNRNRNTQPEQPVAQPPQAERPVATAQPEARTAPIPAAPVASAESTALINHGVYLLTVSGEQTVGKYDESMNHFETIGWEIPVEREEVTVGRQLCVL